MTVNATHVYNRAVEKDLITNRNPFKHVYTGIDKTVKRAIPLKAIKQIKNYYCPVNTNLPSQLAEIHKLGGIFL